MPPDTLGPKAKVEATTQEPQARTLLGVLFSGLGQLYYVARLARPPRVQFSHWASTFRWQFLQQKVGSDDFNGSGQITLAMLERIGWSLTKSFEVVAGKVA